MAAASSAQDHHIVFGVVDRRDATFPDLQEGVGAGGGDFGSLELGPGVGRQTKVGIFHAGGHLNIYGDDQVNDWVDVFDHVVMVLGVVEQVDVGVKNCTLVGVGMWVSPVKSLRAVFRRLHNQRAVAMIPVSRFLVLGIAVGDDIFAVQRDRLQIGVKRVFGHPALEARAGPGRCLEERRLVVARPGVAACARFADVAGEHHRQELGAVGQRGMEPVVDAFTDVHARPDSS